MLLIARRRWWSTRDTRRPASCQSTNSRSFARARGAPRWRGRRWIRGSRTRFCGTRVLYSPPTASARTSSAR
ncbi:hypothetical protein CPLU01_08327 [Colletotrichum plurivorum]|uniref:Uncharacterized protein n=1 Tax=Colletotrichum plurivorum TaxID=2175906 RepID=A0A8H6KDI7_9PEZI|nr:hypothetical protein CPLU01_08327 [Colletotrichum plurivorum]